MKSCQNNPASLGWNRCVDNRRRHDESGRLAMFVIDYDHHHLTYILIIYFCLENICCIPLELSQRGFTSGVRVREGQQDRFIYQISNALKMPSLDNRPNN